MACAMPNAIDLHVELGPMPVDDLNGAAVEGGGLRNLLERKELCDVALVVGGQYFLAHGLVLGAVSPRFLAQIQEERRSGSACLVPGLSHPACTIHFSNVSHPEAVQDMLNCIYSPSIVGSTALLCSTDLANRDVIQLAQAYQIPQLQEQACRWFLQDLTTQNVLVRLAICEEFHLSDVRESILEQLLNDPVALPMLAQDAEIRKVPKVLQDLLVRILKLIGSEPASNTSPPTSSSQRKRGRPKSAGA